VLKVVLFSTSTCSWCRRTKRYFKEHRGPFKGVNTGFSNHYAAVQGGSAGWQSRVGGSVPVGASRISGMLIV
jgi:hypothetical protein